MQDQTVIHPSAVVEPGASIGIGARIGPFCYVGADAVVGDRVVMVSHVSVLNATRIGEGCIVYPMATLGAPPQNAKHQGGRTTLTIGANCTIREGVTMHVGTDMSRGATEVGENGNFLAYAHIAHDCVVGKNATFANGATLEDPSGLFNSSLEGNVRRAIDFHEGGKINEKALKAVFRAAVALNESRATARPVRASKKTKSA